MMPPGEIIMRYRQDKHPHKQIRMLAHQNECSTTDIIDLLELHGVTVVSAKEAHGGQMRKPKKPPIDWDKCMALYKNGVIDTEIARSLGCSPTAVYDWRFRNGLPRNKRTKQSKERS